MQLSINVAKSFLVASLINITSEKDAKKSIIFRHLEKKSVTQNYKTYIFKIKKMRKESKWPGSG